MTNLKEVEKVCKKYENNVELIKKELKRIQSIKCRLKKMKGKSTYQTEMSDILRIEQILKESRNLLEPKDKFVTNYNQEDINQLDYDETIKAIRSIQSKKTLSKWLTTTENDNDEYRNALKIESMLIERRNINQPVDNQYIRKTDIQTIIDTIESNKLSQEKVVELLQKLL